jgi:hypothetical protein
VKSNNDGNFMFLVPEINQEKILQRDVLVQEASMHLSIKDPRGLPDIEH